MAKGQGTLGALVLLLVIGGIVIFFVIPNLGKITYIDEIKYDNDIITIEEFSISSTNPYPDTLVNMYFVVRNNGDEKAENVKVKFNLQGGLTTEELLCGGEDKKEERACSFGEIESLDERMVFLTFKTPPTEFVLTESVYTIEYIVEYDFSGNRIARIPVIDGVTIREPLGEFTQGEMSYGPIHIDFEPPIGATRIEDDREIIERWMYSGDTPTEIKLKLKHVGDRSIGEIEDMNISKGNFRLDLTNDLLYEEGYYCNFEKDPEDENILVSEDDVIVGVTGSTELACNLKFKGELGVPETTATIQANFSYTYKYSNTQDVTVRPAPIE